MPRIIKQHIKSMSEIEKTSLLVIATIFTGVGASTIQSNPTLGIVFLVLAVGILILRGWLKSIGIPVEVVEE